ncbi:unnamed protein product [Prorocentrum cordatum]|uniref:Uncharacterized protein n=1 Tax=Prorocentrum cordatum TaxID=2364126 RepID=A0ABN9WM02_9DINO|nr:unnamed protein product [Polarella glacialis]
MTASEQAQLQKLSTSTTDLPRPSGAGAGHAARDPALATLLRSAIPTAGAATTPDPPTALPNGTGSTSYRGPAAFDIRRWRMCIFLHTWHPAIADRSEGAAGSSAVCEALKVVAAVVAFLNTFH